MDAATTQAQITKDDLERMRQEIASDVASDVAARIIHERNFEDSRARIRNRWEIMALPSVSIVTILIIACLPSLAMMAEPLGALTQVVFVAIKLAKRL